MVSSTRIGIITVRVAGSRVAKMLATVSLVAKLRPQSKVTMLFRWIQSCTYQGLFRPSWSRIACTCSAWRSGRP